METSFLRAILFGWITMVLSLLVTTTLLAFIIRFSSIKEITVLTVSIIVAFFTLFIGGLVAGLKSKSNGIIIGLFTGGGFTLVTFLVQFLGYNDLFSVKQLLFHSAYIVTAIIGSILGVNFMQLKQS